MKTRLNHWQSDILSKRNRFCDMINSSRRIIHFRRFAWHSVNARPVVIQLISKDWTETCGGLSRAPKTNTNRGEKKMFRNQSKAKSKRNPIQHHRCDSNNNAITAKSHIHSRYFNRFSSSLFISYPKAIIRIAIVIVNNIYCIPTYVIWMTLLLPIKRCHPDLYYRVEGLFFHWLLSVVAMWSWTAGYDSKSSLAQGFWWINWRHSFILPPYHFFSCWSRRRLVTLCC